MIRAGKKSITATAPKASKPRERVAPKITKPKASRRAEQPANVHEAEPLAPQAKVRRPIEEITEQFGRGLQATLVGAKNLDRFAFGMHMACDSDRHEPAVRDGMTSMMDHLNMAIIEHAEALEKIVESFTELKEAAAVEGTAG